MSIQMPDDDLPREPDPPARATDVDKQDPATPDGIPEPEASEVESARLLANQARSRPPRTWDDYADEVWAALAIA